MTERKGKNGNEFVQVWDELEPMLNQRGFDLDEYLSRKSTEYSPDTIRELRISASLIEIGRREAGLDDYFKRKQRHTGRITVIRRTTLIAAAAAVILIAFLFSPHKFPVKQEGQGIVRIISELTLADAVQAAGKEITAPGEINPFSDFKSLVDPFSDPIIDDEQSSFKYFRAADLDNDNRMDFIFAQDGHVVCLDLGGQVKWNYQLTEESFDPEFVPKLLLTLKNKRIQAMHLPDANPDHPWALLPEEPSISDAIPLLRRDFRIFTICDFDNDKFQEVLMWLYGAIFVLNHDGTLQSFTIDNRTAKNIILLDGSYEDLPWEVNDINGDGELEFIIYKMSGFPLTIDGESLYREQPDGSIAYIYNGEPYNARGIYVASHTGKELWHLNLPYHCHRIEVADWDNDNHKEILIDTHSSLNGYVVKYTDEYRSIIGHNFDWESIPAEFVDGVDDTGVAFIIVGMDNGIGQIEEWHEAFDFYLVSDPQNPDSLIRPDLFYCSRFIQGPEGGRIDLIEYGRPIDEQTLEKGEWSWTPGYLKNGEVSSLGTFYGGHPMLAQFQNGIIFPFETSNGPGRVLGLCGQRKVVITDDRYNEIDSFKLDFPTENIPDIDSDPVRDVAVLDIEDIDNDGSPEVLAVFTNIGPAVDPPLKPRSVVKILTKDLQPFHPELGWDTFDVPGLVTSASFEYINDDEQLDIMIVSDYIYCLTLNGNN